MTKKSFPLSLVYQLLEPSPVIMVTTSLDNKPNVMTMSWYMMVDFTPPLIACVMGQEDYSFTLLKKSKECVINIPTVTMAEKMVGIGSTTGAEIDKFKKFGLTPLAASKVAAPLIAECFANLECKVIDMSLAAKYNIFILECVKAWITPGAKRPRTIHHGGNGVFIVDGSIIKLPFRSIS